MVMVEQASAAEAEGPEVLAPKETVALAGPVLEELDLVVWVV